MSVNIIKGFQQSGINIKENEILAPYTTFKIGGSAHYFYLVQNEKNFIKAVGLAEKYSLPYFLLAGGSNILISDNNFSGLVIKNKISNLSYKFDEKENTIVCSTFLGLGVLVEVAFKLGLTGLEWATGIPGTVGGAIRGNAGAYSGQMSDIVENVEVIYNFQKEKRKTLKNNELKFAYRNSIFKNEGNKEIILSTKIKLKKDNKEEIKEKMKNVLNKRKISAIQKYPSAGCIFKNPIVKNDSILKQFEKDKGIKIKNKRIPAGYLIEKSGFSGKKIGQVMVSDKNANFILNIGGATADNVIMLISLIKQKIRDNYNIQLEEEIELFNF